MSRRSLRAGVLAGAGLAVFYGLVVGFASGSLDHLVDQAERDWYLLVPIIVGFGVQVTLIVELHRRQRLHRTTAVAGGAGSGASAVGMVACCAHHVADLAPFIGATGLAAFLLDYRILFMTLGIGVNAIGVTVAARRLRQMRLPEPRRAEACAVA